MELTNSSLSKALAGLEQGRAPLVHSDQGFQYQHLTWRSLLDRAGAVQSMSRRGNCLDNAVAENFFGHVKEELFHRERFETVEDFTQALEEYIEWYNTTRISTALQGLSPAEYRTQALAAQPSINRSNYRGPVQSPRAPCTVWIRCGRSGRWRCTAPSARRW